MGIRSIGYHDVQKTTVHFSEKKPAWIRLIVGVLLDNVALLKNRADVSGRN